ncbi:MAG: glycosyltransferase [Acidobacteriia bacterium]|nr:glycosyltransferase [Terriglobia bacterium]
MRFVMFYHSLVSDWNHGNAHFLRGIASELLARGHDVQVYEPRDGWSYRNLIAGHGEQPVRDFETAYPHLRSHRYDPDSMDLDSILDGADVVIVHEWNPAHLVARFGEHRRRRNYRLYFHDTHHRSVSDPDSIGNLRDFDGVLAYGESLCRRYEENGWSSRARVWHEAADTCVFYPRQRQSEGSGELVWIGNWGDDERTRELHEFLLCPVRSLQLRAVVHGVRYPETALRDLSEAGLHYAGWVANLRVPEIFAQFDMTVHIPRGPYRDQLPGVPTIRVFEALACGIPLVSAPWDDCEHLFEPGKDFLVARDTREMTAMLGELAKNEKLRACLAANGLAAIQARHTCRHRVDELLNIVRKA